MGVSPRAEWLSIVDGKKNGEREGEKKRADTTTENDGGELAAGVEAREPSSEVEVRK
jgi:hypothetical protein